jgi:hypothetical protein
MTPASVTHQARPSAGVSATSLQHLISNCAQYFQLAEILSHYTKKMIGLALGLPSLLAITDEQYYADLPGGRLEAIGRLFKRAVKVYVYPYKHPSSGEIITADTIRLPSPLQHLHALLLESSRVEPLRRYREDLLDIHTPDVLARIRAGDPSWRSSVPPPIVEIIERRSLFGYPPRRHWTGHRQGGADAPGPASVNSGRRLSDRPRR